MKRFNTRWLVCEDRLLTEMFRAGHPIYCLAECLGRTPMGIASRLVKLRLLSTQHTGGQLYYRVVDEVVYAPNRVRRVYEYEEWFDRRLLSKLNAQFKNNLGALS